MADDPTAEARIAKIERLARQQNGGAAMRAREHGVASGVWLTTHRMLTVGAGLLAAIAGASILSEASGGWRTFSGVAALISAAFAGIDNSLGAAERAQDHKTGHDGFTALRTKWLTFVHFKTQSGLSPAELQDQYDELVAERDALQERVPIPPEWAKKRAATQKAREAARKSTDAPDDDEAAAP